MIGQSSIWIIAAFALAVFTGGIAVYHTSQHSALAQISSNMTDPYNNTGISLNTIAFPADTIQYNLTYGEWTAMWWQWLYSLPEHRNPGVDQTGEHCHEGQQGPVWFLVGTFGGFSERNCEIPAGKSILFPIMNAACSKLEYPELQTESELRNCAVSLNEGVTELMVTVDGQVINEQQLRSYRVQSPLFDLNLQEGNILTGQQVSTQAVSDGFWVFLPPMAPGVHEIHFRGAIIDFTTAGQNNFVSDALYHITIAG